jgi:hypothetical protein
MHMGKKELRKIIDKCMASGDFHIAYDDAAAKTAQTTLVSLSRQLSVLSENEQPFCFSKINKEILIAVHVIFDSRKKLSRQVDNLLDMFSSKRDLTRQQTRLSGRYKMLPPVSKGPNTAGNYLANCAVAFGEHYDRLEEYKKALETGELPNDKNGFSIFLPQLRQIAIVIPHLAFSGGQDILEYGLSFDLELDFSLTD